MESALCKSYQCLELSGFNCLSFILSALTYIATFFIHQPNQLSRLGLADIKEPLEFRNFTSRMVWRYSNRNQLSICSFLWKSLSLVQHPGQPRCISGGSAALMDLHCAAGDCLEVWQPPSDLPESLKIWGQTFPISTVASAPHFKAVTLEQAKRARSVRPDFQLLPENKELENI